MTQFFDIDQYSLPWELALFLEANPEILAAVRFSAGDNIHLAIKSSPGTKTRPHQVIKFSDWFYEQKIVRKIVESEVRNHKSRKKCSPWYSVKRGAIVA